MGEVAGVGEVMGAVMGQVVGRWLCGVGEVVGEVAVLGERNG